MIHMNQIPANGYCRVLMAAFDTCRYDYVRIGYGDTHYPHITYLVHYLIRHDRTGGKNAE